MLANQLALDLPMSASAPALARRGVERLLLEGGSRQTALLLVSELVSNALRHSGAGGSASIHLRAKVSAGALRMSVTDAGSGFTPAEEPREPGSDGGFGLFLVERLSESWGVETGAATTVWLEMRVVEG